MKPRDPVRISIVDDYDVVARMDTMFDRIVLEQWLAIERSIPAINAVLDGSGGKSEDFWLAVDTVLSSLNRIARVFWPVGGRSATKARGSAMRARYRLDENPIDSVRLVRNAMEHYDEKIDTWWAASERKTFADRLILASDQGVGLAARDESRRFNVDTLEVVVFGQRVEFQKALDNVGAIVKLVNQQPAWPTI